MTSKVIMVKRRSCYPSSQARAGPAPLASFEDLSEVDTSSERGSSSGGSNSGGSGPCSRSSSSGSGSCLWIDNTPPGGMPDLYEAEELTPSTLSPGSPRAGDLSGDTLRDRGSIASTITEERDMSVGGDTIRDDPDETDVQTDFDFDINDINDDTASLNISLKFREYRGSVTTDEERNDNDPVTEGEETVTGQISPDISLRFRECIDENIGFYTPSVTPTPSLATTRSKTPTKGWDALLGTPRTPSPRPSPKSPRKLFQYFAKSVLGSELVESSSTPPGSPKSPRKTSLTNLFKLAREESETVGGTATNIAAESPPTPKRKFPTLSVFKAAMQAENKFTKLSPEGTGSDGAGDDSDPASAAKTTAAGVIATLFRRTTSKKSLKRNKNESKTPDKSEGGGIGGERGGDTTSDGGYSERVDTPDYFTYFESCSNIREFETYEPHKQQQQQRDDDGDDEMNLGDDDDIDAYVIKNQYVSPTHTKRVGVYYDDTHLVHGGNNGHAGGTDEYSRTRESKVRSEKRFEQKMNEFSAKLQASLKIKTPEPPPAPPQPPTSPPAHLEESPWDDIYDRVANEQEKQEEHGGHNVFKKCTSLPQPSSIQEYDSPEERMESSPSLRGDSPDSPIPQSPVAPPASKRNNSNGFESGGKCSSESDVDLPAVVQLPPLMLRKKSKPEVKAAAGKKEEENGVDYEAETLIDDEFDFYEEVAIPVLPSSLRIRTDLTLGAMRNKEASDILKTSAIERPRAGGLFLNPASLETFISSASASSGGGGTGITEGGGGGGEKLTVKLPRDDGSISPGRQRKKSLQSWSEFCERGLSPKRRESGATGEGFVSRGETPSPIPSSQPPKEGWINLENIIQSPRPARKISGPIKKTDLPKKLHSSSGSEDSLSSASGGGSSAAAAITSQDPGTKTTAISNGKTTTTGSSSDVFEKMTTTGSDPATKFMTCSPKKVPPPRPPLPLVIQMSLVAEEPESPPINSSSASSSPPSVRPATPPMIIAPPSANVSPPSSLSATATQQHRISNFFPAEEPYVEPQRLLSPGRDLIKFESDRDESNSSSSE